jgi:hypothetical protein
MDCYDQAVHLRWQSIYREVDTTKAHTARSSAVVGIYANCDEANRAKRCPEQVDAQGNL